MSSKFITAKFAAGLMGVTDRAIYKAIDKRTLPAYKEVVNKQTEVRINPQMFLMFLQQEKQTLVKKLKRIEQAEEIVRRMK